MSEVQCGYFLEHHALASSCKTRRDPTYRGPTQNEILIIPPLCRRARISNGIASGRWRFSYRWDECGKDDLPETLPQDWTRKSSAKDEIVSTNSCKDISSLIMSPRIATDKISTSMTKTQKRKEKYLRRQQRKTHHKSSNIDVGCQALVGDQHQNTDYQPLTLQGVTPSIVKMIVKRHNIYKRTISDDVLQFDAKVQLICLVQSMTHSFILLLPSQSYVGCILFSLPNRIMLSPQRQLLTVSYSPAPCLTSSVSLSSKLSGGKRLRSDGHDCLNHQKCAHKKRKMTLPKRSLQLHQRSKGRSLSSQNKVGSYWTSTFVATENGKSLETIFQRQDLNPSIFNASVKSLSQNTIIEPRVEWRSATSRNYDSFKSLYDLGNLHFAPKGSNRDEFENIATNTTERKVKVNSTSFSPTWSIRKRPLVNKDKDTQVTTSEKAGITNKDNSPLRDISNNQTKIPSRGKFKFLLHKVRDRLTRSTSHSQRT